MIIIQMRYIINKRNKKKEIQRKYRGEKKNIEGKNGFINM